MNSQVLIDLLREVLPSVRFHRGMGGNHKDRVGDLVERIDAALVTPTTIPDAGEGVESWIAETPAGGSTMVISLAQHNRIVSALQASSGNAAPVQYVSVPDGYVLADKKSLGTILQALVNAPHYIRELQETREPAALFGNNPINILIANYEAPASKAAEQ
ncbi:MAG: hypothetical protein K2X80_02795 [Pseudomonadaceae bacterium]|nr:hypothetical protein [Pseudomonadaceae bacterium]